MNYTEMSLLAEKMISMNKKQREAYLKELIVQHPELKNELIQAVKSLG